MFPGPIFYFRESSNEKKPSFFLISLTYKFSQKGLLSSRFQNADVYTSECSESGGTGVTTTIVYVGYSMMWVVKY